jgi:hypothetical protein
MKTAMMTPIEWIILSLIIFKAFGVVNVPLWLVYAPIVFWVAVRLTWNVAAQRKAKNLLDRMDAIDEALKDTKADNFAEEAYPPPPTDFPAWMEVH